MDTAILRVSQVVRETGMSRITVWRRVKAGKFPAPVKLGTRMIGWRTAEVQEWMKQLEAAA